MKKKIVALAGASGLIGSHLTMYMKEYKVLKINREDFLLKDMLFAERFKEADIIINLSGAPILRRWTKKYRQEILDSRIRTTCKLKCISDLHKHKNRLFVSASAIGIYNDVNLHDEESTLWGKGYLAEVVQLWENAAKRISSEKTKVCILRTGVVLSHSGGMMRRILPFFRLGLGGRIGSGKQHMSWIHVGDLCRALDYIITNNKEGIYNITAPEYTSNKEFTRYLARALRKPAIFVLPAFVIRLMFGQGAAVLTGGQAALPQRLIKEGFKFNYPDISSALKDIVN